jgi:hypothetical protein
MSAAQMTILGGRHFLPEAQNLNVRTDAQRKASAVPKCRGDVMQGRGVAIGEPCVVGCKECAVDSPHRLARLADSTVHDGDWLSIDGEAGTIHLGCGQIMVERGGRTRGGRAVARDRRGILTAVP